MNLQLILLIVWKKKKKPGNSAHCPRNYIKKGTRPKGMSEFGWNYIGKGTGVARRIVLTEKRAKKQRGADQPPGENHQALTSKHDTDAIDHERASE